MRSIVRINILALVVLCALASCRKGPRVIPRNTLAEIYAEMLVADSWLDSQDGNVKKRADSTFFYEPIFNSKGYTLSDYLLTIDVYLKDPERFNKILKKTQSILEEGSKVSAKDIKIQELKDAIRLNEDLDDKFIIYDTLFRQMKFRDSIVLERSTRWAIVPKILDYELWFEGPSVLTKADFEHNDESEEGATISFESVNRSKVEVGKPKQKRPMLMEIKEPIEQFDRL